MIATMRQLRQWLDDRTLYRIPPPRVAVALVVLTALEPVVFAALQGGGGPLFGRGLSPLALLPLVLASSLGLIAWVLASGSPGVAAGFGLRRTTWPALVIGSSSCSRPSCRWPPAASTIWTPRDCSSCCRTGRS